jgi:hypothetical protein
VLETLATAGVAMGRSGNTEDNHIDDADDEEEEDDDEDELEVVLLLFVETAMSSSISSNLS